MTYAAGRKIYDADSHVMETREWLDPFMDEDLKAKLRPLYGHKPGRIDKILDAAKARRGDAAAEAKAFDNPIAGPKGWIAAGAFDPGERTRVLDLFGFSGQLVFGTAGLGPVRAAKDEGVLYAGIRAHNDAMAAFCNHDQRLYGVAYVPLDNPARALDEANAAIVAGNRAIMVSAGPAGDKSPGHPDFDPIWALLSEDAAQGIPKQRPRASTRPARRR